MANAKLGGKGSYGSGAYIEILDSDIKIDTSINAIISRRIMYI